jgi:aspartate aminotransferase-like enzyme
MINHRGPAFRNLIQECKAGLQWAFQTRNEVLIFPSSGTGGLEAAVQNLVNPGERTLFVSVGAFGDRFASAGEAYGADVIKLDYPWGHGAMAQDVAQILDDNPEIQVVFVTHNETSTGVCNDIAAIAAEVKQRGRLIAVDAVSSLSSIDLPVDTLQLDVVVSGSQKGWMLPPGCSFVSVSEPAFERQGVSRAPRFYFDIAKERDYEARGETFTTPAVSIMFGLRESLLMMREEGLQRIFQRHRDIARGIRAAVQALELELFADPRFYSDTVTAVKAPRDDAELNKQLIATLRDELELELAGGQAHLKGHVFRIGHLGDINRQDGREMVERLEQALIRVGYIDGPVGAARAYEEAVGAELAAVTPASQGHAPIP